MELTTLKVSKRESDVKSSRNRLRNEGKIPAVYYGKTQEPVSVVVDAQELRTLYAPGKRYTLLDLEIDGKGGNPAIVYDVQKDIITQDITHIDFLQIDEEREVKVRIPVRLEGVPYGVKTEGGQLFQDTRSVVVSCLPKEIPVEYRIDITDFKAKDTFYLENLDIGNAKTVTAPRAVLFTISKGRKK